MNMNRRRFLVTRYTSDMLRPEIGRYDVSDNPQTIQIYYKKEQILLCVSIQRSADSDWFVCRSRIVGFVIRAYNYDDNVC